MMIDPVLRKPSLSLLGVLLACCIAASSSGEPAPPLTTARDENGSSSRSFLMGMSDWSCGPESADKQQTLDRIYRHSDLICFQFDNGAPWPEAFANEEFGAPLQETIRSRLARLKQGHRIYLEIGALNMDRSEITGYWGNAANQPRPAPWDGYAIDDGRMITAYANYCNYLIEQFQPSLVNYSLECTDYLHHQPGTWRPFVRFHQGVYDRIKARHPQVLLGVSMPLKHPQSAEAANLRRRVPDLRPCIDFLAVSAYPYVFFGHQNAGDPAALPSDWFRQAVEIAGDKPLAVGETNWIAQDLKLAKWNIDVKAGLQWQQEYAALMLETLNEHNGLFVIWWSIADYDRLWETFPAEVKELGRIWRDTGLLDESLEPRPAMATWDQWLAKPVKLPVSMTQPTEPRRPAAGPANEGQKQIGFSKRADLFTGPPADRITLAGEGPRPGVSAMHWAYSFKAGEFSWCLRQLPAKLAADARMLTFAARSDRGGSMFVQVEEASGEAFHQVIQIGKTWQVFRVALAEMSLDEEKRRDGTLDPAEIHSLMLADPAGTENASGSRVVWIADLKFE